MTSCIEVTRGSSVESRHIVHAAVVHAERGLVASGGDADHVSFVRSAIKMFQALPLAEDDVAGAYAFSGAELALCTASHNGEPFHVDAALRLMAKADADEHLLACGPHEPLYGPAAEALRQAGEKPRRIHNNCSGKHAGMLVLAHHHGWPLDGYHLLGHPIQQRVRKTLAAWADVEESAIHTAIDGCGLPTFALPLQRVAMACARFAAAADDGGPAATIANAMMSHPEFVGGTGTLDTTLMRVASRRVFAKVGAEGYYCAGVPARRLGVALKVEDGSRRASEPALIAILRTIDALSDADVERLAGFARPLVYNTRGEMVGEIRPRIQLG
jgi:L-asparaginase II